MADEGELVEVVWDYTPFRPRWKRLLARLPFIGRRFLPVVLSGSSVMAWPITGPSGLSQEEGK